MFTKKISIYALLMIACFSVDATPQEVKATMARLADRLYCISELNGNEYNDMERELEQAATELEQKLDMNTAENFYQAHEHAFFMAAGVGTKKILQLFLDAGFEVNHRNKNGMTPLMVAALSGNIETVELLCELGADTTLKDNNGITAQDFTVLIFATDVCFYLPKILIAGARYKNCNPFEACKTVIESYSR